VLVDYFHGLAKVPAGFGQYNDVIHVPAIKIPGVTCHLLI
jgi:hypothetical protein